jgi:hypothetical protein
MYTFSYFSITTLQTRDMPGGAKAMTFVKIVKTGIFTLISATA